MSEAVEPTEIIPAPGNGRLPDGKFVKGFSGNPRGRPREQDQLLTLLRAELDNVHPIEKKLAAKEQRQPRTNREVVVYRLVSRALTGDQRAIDSIFNRLYGKVPARVEVTGEVDHVHDHDTRSDQMRKLFEQIAALRPVIPPPREVKD